MRYTIPLFLTLGTIATGLVHPRNSQPCAYHLPNTTWEPAIEDEYIVKLHDHYSITDHFDFLGLNLSESTAAFYYMQHFHGYTISVDKHTMHDLIRYDPGIKYVSQNTKVDPSYHWRQETRGEIDAETQFSHPKLLARWKTIVNTMLNWTARMVEKWGLNEEVKNLEFALGERLIDAGKGVDVYILDTGVRITHEVCAAENAPGSCRNFRKSYVDDGKGFDDVYGENGHGTSVASSVKMQAPWTDIVNVRCVGSGGVPTSVVLEAINDVIADHKDKQKNKPKGWKGSVINMSFTIQPSDALEDVLLKAAEAGIALTTAAGNSGRDQGETPCGYEDLICVGAVNQQYKKWKDSNYNEFVDVYAPGENVPCALNNGDTSWSKRSGTSFASPAVAGVMAIFISYESLDNNVELVYERLRQNWQVGVLIDETDNHPIPNNLLNNGLNNPNRPASVPYLGPEEDKAEDFGGLESGGGPKVLDPDAELGDVGKETMPVVATFTLDPNSLPPSE